MLRKTNKYFTLSTILFFSFIYSQNYQVSTDLNVRSSPSSSGEILGQFKMGQKITVLDLIGNWASVRVQLNDNSVRTAYVHSGYIKSIYNYNTNVYYGSGYKSYDYSVSGDGDGGYVEGEVTVDKYGGDGYIYDDEGNEKWIEVDWTGYGTLEGYDEDGNYYELDVD